jgi:hypothetical protein
LLAKPFVGITTDGNKLKNVFKRKDEGAPVEDMVFSLLLIADFVDRSGGNVTQSFVGGRASEGQS